jgi:hypothetical protein
MNKLATPQQIPQLLSDLSGQEFYGEVTITFTKGEIIRVVTSQSQIFHTKEKPNVHRNAK